MSQFPVPAYSLPSHSEQLLSLLVTFSQIQPQAETSKAFELLRFSDNRWSGRGNTKVQTAIWFPLMPLDLSNWLLQANTVTQMSLPKQHTPPWVPVEAAGWQGETVQREKMMGLWFPNFCIYRVTSCPISYKHKFKTFIWKFGVGWDDCTFLRGKTKGRQTHNFHLKHTSLSGRSMWKYCSCSWTSVDFSWGSVPAPTHRLLRVKPAR